MKRFFGFLGFLIPWTVFVLDFPDLFEKLAKWVPMLKSASALLTNGVSNLIGTLPRAPECGNCFAFYWFWPTLVSMGAIFAAYILFRLAYIRLPGEAPSNFLGTRPGVLALLFFVSQLIMIYLVQSWLLHKYSGLDWAKVLPIVLFNSRVRAAHDKNFFLHASNIYGVIVIVSYLGIILLARLAWDLYKRNPEAKPPNLD